MPALPSPLACVYTSIVKQALCNIDNNLNIRCHIIHRHVHTCQHHLPPQSTSCMYKSMHIYTTKSQSTKASMVKYVHVSICAFDPSTNASIQVNRQHNALSTIISVHKCQHRLQSKSVCTSTTTHMSKHIYYKVCLVSMSTCTYMPSLPSILACVYMLIVNPSPTRCRQ